ncbi:MAG: 2Fe-2S iron-sulfur cluster binding domain-containing protein [Planctomycetes bacterium]|nr:2Fe-2S iron-sulfur cluster binding domain-containing protein [Planctomycetota bacterium]
MSGMHRVHFRNENLTVDVPTGTNLRTSCLQFGVDPYPVLGGLVSCRGKGFCGTCMVSVDEPSALCTPSKREAKFLKKAKAKYAPEVAEHLRLSCQATVQGDVVVTTDPDTKPGWHTHPYYSGRPIHSWKISE